MLFGGVIAWSAIKLRGAPSQKYWGAALAWTAAIAVAFAFATPSQEANEALAAVVLVGGFPVLAAFFVAKLTTSAVWIATAIVAGAWATTVLGAFVFGLRTGFIHL